ncbi:MAG: hypothetical protein GY820_23690 [Gammaproteobacteria bacterium]|nr:hypothetical protein [Gammaproteobacteria bacterium]
MGGYFFEGAPKGGVTYLRGGVIRRWELIEVIRYAMHSIKNGQHRKR